MTALEELYRERYRGLVHALTPVAGGRDAAHDAVQEAFATALRKGRALRRQESLAAWVWKVAYRLALRERARRKGQPLPADLAAIDEARDPELAAALRTLPEQRRLVVFLRYFAGFSYREIAEALEIAEGTVAATLTQARNALLEQLEEVNR